MVEFRTMKRFRTLAAGWILLVTAAFSGTGCDELSTPDPEVDRAAIEQVLRAYLPELAEAYRTGKVDGLRSLAVEKEIVHVYQMIDQLNEQGQVYEPELQQLTLETFKVWNYSNAYATTVETWDVRSFALGSHVQLSAVEGQKNRVRYQLKRKDTGWVILYRELMETLD